MNTTISVCDETPLGQRSSLRVLDLLTETISVRELIRERVYQEVREFNAASTEYFNGLVMPTEAEQTLNGFKMHRRRPIQWEDQFAKAVEAFTRNGFFILVDDRQVESLDEEIQVRSGQTVVSFVRLVPLVGG